MSVTIQCEKEFTLTVQDALPLPVEYWKLDEVAGNRVGQRTGMLLVEDFAPPVGSAPGKIGLAARFINSAFPYTELGSSPFFNTVIKDQGIGWTIAGWANVTDVFQKPIGLFFYDAGFNVKGFVSLDNQGPGFRARAIGEDDNGILFTAIAPDIPTPGTFYFFRIWFNPGLGIVQCQINDGNVGASIGGLIFPARDYGSLQMTPDSSFNPGLIMLVDEFGIWMPPLTDAQATLLYNAAAGKTCCPFT